MATHILNLINEIFHNHELLKLINELGKYVLGKL